MNWIQAHVGLLVLVFLTSMVVLSACGVKPLTKSDASSTAAYSRNSVKPLLFVIGLVAVVAEYSLFAAGVKWVAGLF